MGSNLQISGTGLDHIYLNGLPVIEVEISIKEVFEKVARITATAVQADPYFSQMTKDQKAFSQLHGEGDRKAIDFLKEGARDILPIFSPLQRWIGENTYYQKDIKIENSDLSENATWESGDPENVFVKDMDILVKSGSADITILVDGEETNTVSLDESAYTETIELSAKTIELQIANSSEDFIYDLKINTIKNLKLLKFEFDSVINPNKVIYRYQNMDSRPAGQKFNYTNDNLYAIKIDPNTFDEVIKYTTDSLKNYVLKEFYETIGYDKKALEYTRKYEQSRSLAKFWVRSEKGLLI